MKVLIILCGLLGAIYTASQQGPISLLRQERQINGDNFYKSSDEIAKKIAAEEQEYLKNAGQQVQGQYQFTDADGKTFQFDNAANENDVHPQGGYLPVPRG